MKKLHKRQHAKTGRKTAKRTHPAARNAAPAAASMSVPQPVVFALIEEVIVPEDPMIEIGLSEFDDSESFAGED